MTVGTEEAVAESALGAQSPPSAAVMALPPVWVIMGPPGSGKGTYAEILARRFHLEHISTGDLVRAAAERPDGAELRRIMNDGKLIPDWMMVALLLERLSDTSRSVHAVLLDGFPRTVGQAQLLDKMCQVQIVVNIALKDEHILAKIAGRCICKTCGRGYNTADVCDSQGDVYMPPILPKCFDGGSASTSGVDKSGAAAALRCDCGGPLTVRTDDEKAIAVDRLCQHHIEAPPVLEFFSKEGVVLEHRVRRGTEDMDTLAARIAAQLNKAVSGTDQRVAPQVVASRL